MNADHYCPAVSSGPTPGDDCPICDARISAREWSRDQPGDEYPEGRDWHWPIGKEY